MAKILREYPSLYKILLSVIGKIKMNPLLCAALSISVLLISVVSSFELNNKPVLVKIVNSGSSNTAGYVIELLEDGTVTLTVAPRRQPILSSTQSNPTRASISPDLVNQLRQSVEQALPFDQYTSRFCIKSVSFGTALHLIYQNQQSPDLNCPLEDGRLVSLNKVVREVISVLHINTLG